MLIHQIMQNKDPNKTCLIYGQNSITYGLLEKKSYLLARQIAPLLNTNKTILLALADPLEQLIYFFASIIAGGIPIFAPAKATDNLVDQLMQEQSIQNKITTTYKPTSDLPCTLPNLQASDIFFGAFTSGSTGKAKIIWRDHQSWTSAFPHQSTAFSLGATDTLFLCGSLSFTANLNSCLHMLYAGGRVVISTSSLPRSWLKELSQNQVSALFMVPANYRILLKNIPQPLTAIQSVVSCGAKLDNIAITNLKKSFPKANICEYYGAAELGHISYACNQELDQLSVGKPFPGVKITLEEDVIWIKSPYIAPAFRPQATVGDLGRFDNQGRLQLIGRKQNIINSGGIKISPEQVEQVLRQCPGISEAAVIAADDKLRGKIVCAFIVKNAPNLQNKDVLAFCRDHLTPGHFPHKLIFLDSMPLNNSGKTNYPLLQQKLHPPTIKSLLPQREPFLFLDQLLEVDRDLITGSKTYDKDFIFAQQFAESKQEIPPTILIESLIQCGGAGARQLGLTPPDSIFALASINKVKIHAKACLPVTITMEIETQKASNKILCQSGQAMLQNKIILTAQWCCMAIKTTI